MFACLRNCMLKCLDKLEWVVQGKVREISLKVGRDLIRGGSEIADKER